MRTRSSSTKPTAILSSAPETNKSHTSTRLQASKSRVAAGSQSTTMMDDKDKKLSTSAEPTAMESVVEVDPHTLRLIRLIEYPSTTNNKISTSAKTTKSNGIDTNTSTSSPHLYAQQAAAALGHTAQQHSKTSPLVLWDILGRLRHIALSEGSSSSNGNDNAGNNSKKKRPSSSSSNNNKQQNHVARYYAALAMSEVARHLPLQDRRDFCHGRPIENKLNDNKKNKDKTSQHSSKEDVLWLTVQDLRKPSNDEAGSASVSNGEHDNSCVDDTSITHNNTMCSVLEHGRELLSKDHTDFDLMTDGEDGILEANMLEDTVLQTLDQKAIESMGLMRGNISNENENVSAKDVRDKFVQARVRYQRTVMARRLGLLLPPSIGGGIHAQDFVIQELLGSGAGDGSNDLVGECVSSHDVKQSLDVILERKAKEAAEFEEAKSAKKRKRGKKKADDKAPKNKRAKAPKTAAGKKNDEEETKPNADAWHKRYGSVRALLVLDMNSCQQEENGTTTTKHHYSKSNHSHESPQTLLATDLLYCMFHPAWHVRHGACLSIMALLQAWWTPSDRNHNRMNSKNGQRDGQTFGKWLQDILARSLCVLCLDRFGDFSMDDNFGGLLGDDNDTLDGGDTGSSSPGNLTSFAASSCFAFLRNTRPSLSSTSNAPNSNPPSSSRASVSGRDNKVYVSHAAETAPVRDVAARLVAALWHLAPLESQSDTLEILLQMIGYDDDMKWEVRQGGLLGLLHILAGIDIDSKDQDGCSMPTVLFTSSGSGKGNAPLNEILRLASKSLLDSSDDARAAAARVLEQILRLSSSSPSEAPTTSIARETITAACSSNLWKALQDVHDVSSCVGDLLSLLAALVSTITPPPSVGTASSSTSNFSVCDLPNESGSEVLQKLMQFMDYDAISCQICTLQVIGKIVPSLVLNHQHQFSRQKDNNGAHAFLDILLKIITKLFLLFWSEESRLVSLEEDVKQQYRIARDSCWKHLAQVMTPKLWAPRIGQRDAQRVLTRSFVDLISIFFGLEKLSFKEECETDIAAMAAVSSFAFESLSSFTLSRDMGFSALHSSAGHEETSNVRNGNGDANTITTPLYNDASFDAQIKASKALALLSSHLLGDAEEMHHVDNQQRQEENCSHQQNVKVASILQTVIGAFVHSPWHHLTEAALLLYTSIIEESDQTPALAAFLQNVRSLTTNEDSFLSVLNGDETLLCIELDDIEGGNTARSDRRMKTICHEAFQTKFKPLLVSSHDHAIDVSQLTKDLTRAWRSIVMARCVQSSQDDEVHICDDPATTLIKIKTDVSIAIVSRGASCLPSKVTPLVQALMTSFQNETQPMRLQRTAEYTVKLIVALAKQDNANDKTTASPPRNEKIRFKIIDSLCQIVCNRWKNAVLTGAAGGYRGAAENALVALMEEFHETGLKRLSPLEKRVRSLEDTSSEEAESEEEQAVCGPLYLLQVVSSSFRKARVAFKALLSVIPHIVELAVSSGLAAVRNLATDCITNCCASDATLCMPCVIPAMFNALRNVDDETRRLGGAKVLHSIVDALGVCICPFVKCLLPAALSSMNDDCLEVSRLSASTFGALVRAAPLVREDDKTSGDESSSEGDGQMFKSMAGLPLFSTETDADDTENVIAHLIFGKPLPPCDIPKKLLDEMKGVELRPYQKEGVAWIRFLATVHLNGALCDDMGLGKTLQTLAAVGISHCGSSPGDCPPTLVVCPASVVGHWMNEIHRFFPTGSVFHPFQYTGSVKKRKALWNKTEAEGHNIIVTSYAMLRNDIELLSNKKWNYCILDEGHLLKNPKTGECQSFSSQFDHYFYVSPL
jgi:hypothetical protein